MYSNLYFGLLFKISLLPVCRYGRRIFYIGLPHTSEKSQGKVFFFKVREMSGNLERPSLCQPCYSCGASPQNN